MRRVLLILTIGLFLTGCNYKIVRVGDDKNANTNQDIPVNQNQDIKNINNNEPTPAANINTNNNEAINNNIKPPAKSDSQDNFKIRISNQLQNFDYIIEKIIYKADLDCYVFATYNNASHYSNMSPELFATAFPESKETYSNNCQKSNYLMSMSESQLVAEPELKNLRVMISDYMDTVKAFASFAIDGGYDAATLDNFSAESKKLLTNCREEVIRIRRAYNL